MKLVFLLLPVASQLDYILGMAISILERARFHSQRKALICARVGCGIAVALGAGMQFGALWVNTDLREYSAAYSDGEFDHVPYGWLPL